MKFWDLDTQHCFKTLVVHRTEVWDFVLVRNDTRLITGSVDTELRVFELGEPDEAAETAAKRLKTDEANDSDDDEVDESLHLVTCVKLGSLQRHGKGRVLGISCDKHDRYLLCHGNENLSDVFKVFTLDESVAHFEKRRKKARKRARTEVNTETDEVLERGVNDEFRRIGAVKMTSKIRSMDIVSDRVDTFQVCWR